MITQAELKETLVYNENTGIFTWAVKRNGVKKGAIAGWVNSGGHIQITIKGTHHYAHRLAWLYVHDEHPSGQIDHVNRVKSDNRISNLRDVTHTINQWNVGLKNTNSSGYKGVSYAYRQKKWKAAISSAKKYNHIGYYETKERAYVAYKIAAHFRDNYS